MRDGHADYQTNKWSLLKYFFVIPTLVALGCASAPDLLPVGSPDMAKRDGVRRVVAYSDFPVLVSKMNDDKDLQVAVVWRGKMLGYKTIPFATAKRVQFNLSQPGTSKVLCTFDIQNTGNETDYKSCEFNVRDYFSIPLVGELTYWFEDKEPEPETVIRTYYLIEQPKPIPPPQTGTIPKS